MKTASVVLSLAFVGVSAFAANDMQLLKKVKESGIKAIPQSQLELLKLVDDPNNPITEKKVELGKKLYFEPRLSKSGLISCNTCHNLGMGGADGVAAAIGHKWTANPAHLNSPTVYNSVLNKVQFWDGRSPHLEDQAQGPIQAGPEMAAPKELVVARVTSMPEYVEEFKSAYGDKVKIDFKLIADTIAVFERTLVTPSRFDDFLHGDLNALTPAEKEGLNLFVDKGCVSCHNDIGLGGTMQPFQVAKKYKFASLGGFQGDKNGMVKTPTLRNIEETAPYFHNGAIWSLADAVKEMGSVQLGINISDKESKKIVTFLKALTGDKPEVSYPILPVSTPKTPKPDMN
ncbi:cytochrome-c peroxidase [Halarcobacter bivalviorum]|uniref:Cytochrome C biogenesis protein CcsA n=1 Tax=Halarcobacter bivalviorum TaxID=663364 RepID=A0AAX2A9S0_9BACT|nr:cytochrome-c peroxidase [Halarcobacter bivalviorum]AXH11734.1 periplasmic diheme cytochrome c peroxidase [Halarcobacter bivalviorum]RXK10863.1 cytochrome C biogenesis protein CcsA [Halarcobacter bivalviorum]